LCLSRTLTYCIWNLIAGDDEQETRATERIALPPPIKRRDYHLRMFEEFDCQYLIEIFLQHRLVMENMVLR